MSTEVIIRDNTAIVTTEIDYYVPINYGAQGPEGALGPAGPAGLPGPVGPQGIQGPAGISADTMTISVLADVNMSGLVDGALLAYDIGQSKWAPTVVLSKQTLECGQY